MFYCLALLSIARKSNLCLLNISIYILDKIQGCLIGTIYYQLCFYKTHPEYPRPHSCQVSNISLMTAQVDLGHWSSRHHSRPVAHDHRQCGHLSHSSLHVSSLHKWTNQRRRCLLHDISVTRYRVENWIFTTRTLNYILNYDKT